MPENKGCQLTNATIVEPAVVILCLFCQVWSSEVARSDKGPSEADLISKRIHLVTFAGALAINVVVHLGHDDYFVGSTS